MNFRITPAPHNFQSCRAASALRRSWRFSSRALRRSSFRVPGTILWVSFGCVNSYIFFPTIDLAQFTHQDHYKETYREEVSKKPAADLNGMTPSWSLSFLSRFRSLRDFSEKSEEGPEGAVDGAASRSGSAESSCSISPLDGTG